jgi:hypothetical protein
VRPIRRKDVDFVVDVGPTAAAAPDPVPTPADATPGARGPGGADTPANAPAPDAVPAWFSPGDFLPEHLEGLPHIAPPSGAGSTAAPRAVVVREPFTPAAVGAPSAGSAGPGPGNEPGAPPVPGHSARLGDMLVAAGTITADQLDLALTEQIASGLRLGTQLIQGRAFTERQLVETLADQLGLPVVDLRLTVPTPEAIADLPEALARRWWNALPRKRTADSQPKEKSTSRSTRSRAIIAGPSTAEMSLSIASAPRAGSPAIGRSSPSMRMVGGAPSTRRRSLPCRARRVSR